MCYFGQTLAPKYYDAYVTGSPDLTHFDVPSGTWNDNRGVSQPMQYFFDASETNGTNSNMCMLCQYHKDPYFTQPDKSRFVPPIGGGQQSLNWAPFFGPCLSGSPSLSAQCVQNVALFPPTFVGRYFYPVQQPLPVFDQLFGAGNYPIHLFLSPSDPLSNANEALGCSAPKPPTEFQLGSNAILGDLDTFKIINRTTGAVDVNATANLTNPYRTNTVNVGGSLFRSDGWVKWAQHWCSPGCHRNARYYTVRVTTADYVGKPQNSYLSRFTQSGVTNQLVVCKDCPVGFASYYWNNVKNPEEPMRQELNVAAQGCYPWFGLIPQMVPDPNNAEKSRFNSSTLFHSAAIDNVLTPDSEEVVVGIPCPVNTFNRECAHAKRWYYWQYELNTAAWDDVTAAQFMQQYQCTPCLPGWHTNGTTGAWFCLPPAGQVLVYGLPPYTMLSRDPSRMPLWANRDLIQAEMECGYLPSHCQQCASMGMPAGTLPSDFNEKAIWSTILTNKSCESRYYCPDAFTSIRCPVGRPYSPPGSWLPEHCSCDAGMYLTSGGLCVACTIASSCQVGYYLPPTCMNNPNQKNDTVCARCENVPGNATLSVACGGGVCSTFLQGANRGVCSFQCNFGFILETDDSTCAKNMRCVPVGVIRSPAQSLGVPGVPMYKPGLSAVDRFVTAYCTLQFPFDLAFSNLISSSLTKTSDGYSGDKVTFANGWNPTGGSTFSCAECGAGVKMCYNSRVPWYSITADVSCVPCPHPNPPLNGISNSDGDVAMYAATCSLVTCSIAGTYFNESAWACQSCAARAAIVCPSSAGNNNMQLVGQGCMGNSRPFNLSSPASDCVQCDKNASGAPAGYFLKLDPVAPCAFTPCRASAAPGSQYMVTRCGGTTDAVWAYCDVGNQTHGPCAGKPNSFVSQPCTNLTNQVCSPCTAIKEGGYYIDAPCSNGAQDTVWKECLPGFYCDRTGTQTRCPNGKTSRNQTASAAGCYCMPGTIDDGSGGCRRFFCDDSVGLAGNLGDANMSVFYVYVDLTLTPPVSSCIPCGNTAFSRGDGISFASCVCPFGYAGTVSGAGKDQRLACAPCPTTPQPSCDGQHSPGPMCWKGDMRGAQSCVCAAPPFAELKLGESGGCGSQCLSPFNKSASSAANAVPAGSSGSALYVTQTRSRAGWTQFASAPPAGQQTGQGIVDYDIVAFAVTSDYADTDYSNVNLEAQYALWCVDSLNIFVTQVPMVNADGVSVPIIYENTANWNYYQNDIWAALASRGDVGANNMYDVVGLAVSQWRRSSTKVRVQQVLVGVVVLETYPGDAASTPQLLLVTNTLSFQGGSAVWGVGSGVSKQLVAAKEIQMVGIVHSNVIPPQSTDQGEVFYVAYNKHGGCGGIVLIAPLAAAGNTGGVSQSIGGVCLPDATRRITAFALRTAARTTFTIYISFGASVYALQMPAINGVNALVTSATPVYVAAAGDVFAGGLLALFTTYPLLVARTTITNNGTTGQLQAGDRLQRTFLPIEGLPWGTKTSAVGLAGAATSYFSGVLVAASGEGLYAIDVRMCPPSVMGLPQYWDGGDPFTGTSGQMCVTHQCLRPAFCQANEIATQGYSCKCVDGYKRTNAGAPCTQCLAGTTYCKSEIEYNCPYNTQTRANGASRENDCACSGSSGMFMDSAASPMPSCTTCARSAWCPNNWQTFACPGSVDITRSTTGNTYPTACTCAAGSVGANCDPCPDGYYCPSSLTSQVTNAASILLVAAQTGGLLTQGAVVDAIVNGLLSYFTPLPNVPRYLAVEQTLRSRLFVQYIPATNHSQSMVAVMVQTDKGSENSLGDWATALRLTLANGQAGFTVTGFGSGQSAAVTQFVQNNTATLCQTGRVPSAMRDVCVCAPGYASSTTAGCAACSVGTFKDFAGTGQCSKCAAGLTSKAGAGNCSISTSNSPSPSSSSQDAAGGTMIYIVAGAVGGLLLIFGLMACVVHGKSSSTQT